MDNVLNLILNNFDFGLIISINVLVYIIVKATETFNEKLASHKWYKMLCTLLVSIILSVITYFLVEIEPIKLLNSTICATVIWDWVLKPILQKFKIDYQND